MHLLWILLCGAVGWGESKESKRPLYEAGLRTGWITANLFEYLLPQDQRVLPDLSITKILYTPPYNKQVKLIRTAKEHTPVRIQYLFQGVTDNSTDRLQKGKWLCFVNIDEHFHDGEFLYLYPWNNGIHCEVDDEGDSTGGPNETPPVPPTKGPTKTPPVPPTKGPTKNPTKGPTEAPKGGSTKAPKGGSTNAPKAGSTKAPKGGSTNAPKAGSTKAPKGGSTNAPKGGSTNAPKGGSTNAPKAGSTNAPKAGSTKAPKGGSTNAPKGGSTNAPKAGSTKAPKGGSTNAPKAGSTKAPLPEGEHVCECDCV